MSLFILEDEKDGSDEEEDKEEDDEEEEIPVKKKTARKSFGSLRIKMPSFLPRKSSRDRKPVKVAICGVKAVKVSLCPLLYSA